MDNQHSVQGYQNLHPNPGLNFTLNRLVTTIPEEELRAVASSVATLPEWIQQMRAAADRAEHEGRLEIAARYLHAAEFYMTAGDEGKAEIYRHSIDLMDRAVPEMALARDQVPYGSGFLPIVRIAAVGEQRDVLLIHSGFDGLVEEMYRLLPPLAEAGYTVIAFEGPGQGAALRQFDLPMPFDWERPVAAVLDHYDISSCTLVGMSLGGYLAARAAAYEKRVKRVVSWGAMYDFFACYRLRLGSRKFRILETLLKRKLSGVVNAMIRRASEKDDILKWASNHGMHVSGAKTPYDFFQWVRTLNLRDCAHRIEQDALILMGSEDHLVPSDQLYVQAQAMTGARSVTAVMMTGRDDAAQHCQVGNSFHGLRQILAWLDFLSQRDGSRLRTRV